MRFSFLSVLLILATAATANAMTTAESPSTLALGFGSSLPDSFKATTILDKRGPSRVSGGEVVTLELNNPKTISEIKISAFSASGQGSLLIRDAESLAQGSENAAKLGELFDPALKGQGVYASFQDRIMLPANNYVVTHPNALLKRVRLQVEAFGNDDATLLIETRSADGFNYYDFVTHRTGPSASTGLLLGRYGCGSYADSVIVGVRGLEVYATDGSGSYTMGCDWSTGKCQIKDTDGSNCSTYSWTIASPTSFLWSNPCRQTSGYCTRQ